MMKRPWHNNGDTNYSTFIQILSMFVSKESYAGPVRAVEAADQVMEVLVFPAHSVSVDEDNVPHIIEKQPRIATYTTQQPPPPPQPKRKPGSGGTKK